MWWDHDLSGAGWAAMALGMTGFWVVAALLVIAAVRGAGPRRHTPTDPRVILDERFARGEIDLEEYRARRSALLDRGPGG